MAKDDGFDFDPKAIERLFKGIEKEVLPTAQRGFLNGIAFGARRSLLKHADETIQGSPNAWTKRGFVVKKATTANPEYSVEILPLQATYMTYLVSGGIRRAGDAGATPYDVRVDSADESKNRFGNAQRHYLNRISKRAKREQERRAKLKIRRDKLRSQGKSTEPARWASSTGAAKAGVFFGVIDGKKGYWQRPERGAKFGKPLIRFADEARYRPTFLWDKTIAQHLKSADLQKMYASEIERAIKKLKP